MARIVGLLDYLLQYEDLTVLKKNELLDLEKAHDTTVLEALVNGRFIDADLLIEIIGEIMNFPVLEPQFNKITILDFSKVSEYYSKGYFICKGAGGKNEWVINNPLLLEDRKLCEKYKKYKIKLIKRQEFYNALEGAFSKFNTQKALLELGFFDPQATAKNINYLMSLIKGAGLMTLLMYISPEIFIAVNYIIYLTQTLYKIWFFSDTYLSLPAPKSKSIHAEIRKEYPIYSILVPMYKENYGVRSILNGLDRLIYPKHRLDIKFVIEEDDEISLKILSMIELPEHIHVIKVPYSEPRTKPKALNYAMQYVKGTYIVIYDVEDIPDEDQLIKALDTFENAEDSLICVQAKLNFYNSHFNILSRLFSMEYSIWFNFLLPGLESNNLPIPLGGNSNHFRVEAIKKLGLWDAYNVTEDADLGIRIFMYGYYTKMIDSYTMEEGPVDIPNWIHQRARWIKGFMQTFFVYYGQKSVLKSNMSFSAKIGVYVFIGFNTYSFFVIPWHFYVSIFDFSLENQLLSTISQYLTFLYIYFTASIIVAKDTNYFKNIKLLDCLAFLMWPLYFIVL